MIENTVKPSIDREFSNLSDAMFYIEKLALGKPRFVFRGQQNASWKLESTYQRLYKNNAYKRRYSVLDVMQKFLGGLSEVERLPFDIKDRLSCLEYARHHGLPTPVLDCSYSPYVALYFAFTNLTLEMSVASGKSAIYAFNIDAMKKWNPIINHSYEDVDDHGKPFTQEVEINPGVFEYVYGAQIDRKLFIDQTDEEFFNSGFPLHRLRFVRGCSSWNTRMRNQLGCFLYDSMPYASNHRGFNFDDLQEYINSFRLVKNSMEDCVLLHKITLPHSCAEEVFTRLELMNITGAKMLDKEGLATDVKNSIHYIPRLAVPRDLALLPPLGNPREMKWE